MSEVLRGGAVGAVKGAKMLLAVPLTFTQSKGRAKIRGFEGGIGYGLSVLVGWTESPAAVSASLLITNDEKLELTPLG